MFKLTQSTVNFSSFLLFLREKFYLQMAPFFKMEDIGFHVGYLTEHKNYAMFSFQNFSISNSRDTEDDIVIHWDLALEICFRVDLGGYSLKISNDAGPEDQPSSAVLLMFQGFTNFFLDLELLHKNPEQEFILQRGSVGSLEFNASVVYGTLRLDFGKKSYVVSTTNPLLKEYPHAV